MADEHSKVMVFKLPLKRSQSVSQTSFMLLGLVAWGVSSQAQGQSVVGRYQAAQGSLVCQALNGYAQDFSGRRTFIWRPEWLNQIKQDTSPQGRAVVRTVVNRADAALGLAPFTVVQKTRAPISGDKHDYHSQAPYWWPDATKPNGEPYVRRDGQVNPARDGNGFDANRLSQFSDAVSALSLAHFYTGDTKYATKAAQLIRVWFLDPATRMNPNFAYAQAVPGISAGRPEGIIDGHRLMPVIESIGLLAPTGALSNTEIGALEAWFGEMAMWLETSDLGKQEQAKTNNHAIFYDLLVAHYSLFARMPDRATRIIQAFPQSRIASQFAVDGALPEELSRTRSWHYSHWTLGATAKLAGLGECVGLDLWRATTLDGRGIAKSLSFMANYVARERQWPYPESAFARGEIETGARTIALETFRLAGWGYRDARYEQLAGYYAKQAPTANVHSWLSGFPTPRAGYLLIEPLLRL